MFNPYQINKLPSITQHFKQDQKYFIMMAKKDKIDFVYNTSALALIHDPILNIKAKDRLEFNSTMVTFYDSENMDA